MLLRYLHRPLRRRHIAPRGQPIPKLVQVPLEVPFKLRNRLPVNTSSALVGLHVLPRLPEQPSWRSQTTLLATSTQPLAPPTATWLTTSLVRMAVRLAPAPLQDLQRYYQTVPPLCRTTGTCPSRSLPLETFPEPTGRGSNTTARSARRTTGSHVPYRSLTHARAAYMPDTAWPISRLPPGSSQAQRPDLVSMSSDASRHFVCGSLSLAFIGSHLTRSKARLLPRRSPPRLLTAAARGWFVASSCKALTEDLPPSPAQQGIKNAPVISYEPPSYHARPERPYRTSASLHGARLSCRPSVLC